jgi:hypothetical protein
MNIGRDSFWWPVSFGKKILVIKGTPALSRILEPGTDSGIPVNPYRYSGIPVNSYPGIPELKMG